MQLNCFNCWERERRFDLMDALGRELVERQRKKVESIDSETAVESCVESWKKVKEVYDITGRASQFTQSIEPEFWSLSAGHAELTADLERVFIRPETRS